MTLDKLGYIIPIVVCRLALMVAVQSHVFGDRQLAGPFDDAVRRTKRARQFVVDIGCKGTTRLLLLCASARC